MVDIRSLAVYIHSYYVHPHGHSSHCIDVKNVSELFVHSQIESLAMCRH